MTGVALLILLRSFGQNALFREMIEIQKKSLFRKWYLFCNTALPFLGHKEATHIRYAPFLNHGRPLHNSE